MFIHRHTDRLDSTALSSAEGKSSTPASTRPQSSGDGLVTPTRYSVQPLTLDQARRFRDDLIAVERAALGFEPQFVSRVERELWSRGSAAFVTTDQASNIIVGFTVGRPTIVLREAYISFTALLPSVQGQGLVGPLRGALEDHFRGRGYEFISCDARVDNGYADTIARHYGNRVLERQAAPTAQVGVFPTNFFRIKL